MKQEIIYGDNFEKAKKNIRNLKKSNIKVIFASDDDDLNRKIIEKELPDILLINLNSRKDKMKQRNSGLNEIIAKIAKKNNIKIGINLTEVFQSKFPKEKAEIISRIRQNIRICNKIKLKMEFVLLNNEKVDKLDLNALGLILGMPTWMTK